MDERSTDGGDATFPRSYMLVHCFRVVFGGATRRAGIAITEIENMLPVYVDLVLG